MIRRWLLPLGLFILLLGSSWLLERLGQDTVEQVGDTGQEEPDYLLDNFTTTSVNVTGRAEYRLKARHMVHYPITETKELEKPYLIFFDTERQDRSQKVPIDREDLPSTYPGWHVESERGRILGKGKDEVVFLLGQVHMWKNDEAGAMEIEVHTRDLRILPDANYGDTNEAVTIRTATSETHGIGMRARTKPNHLELLSRVRTIYEKPSR
uniref:Lipopolysaccharide export system protein LptC n=1 Tax=Candidatus Kentrum sp. UNK TaxID=2126344 RepID=A0A451B0W3_9GAMM|nr:MAG: lipopolysaccharide export system protein LptC [Candidatus Kentron sp. UNK]VFK71918.1 MAG: lipopolysaccharide export system protein LptC [Candidatus Kentron sp. UNK]